MIILIGVLFTSIFCYKENVYAGYSTETEMDVSLKEIIYVLMALTPTAAAVRIVSIFGEGVEEETKSLRNKRILDVLKITLMIECIWVVLRIVESYYG